MPSLPSIMAINLTVQVSLLVAMMDLGEGAYPPVLVPQIRSK